MDLEFLMKLLAETDESFTLKDELVFGVGDDLCSLLEVNLLAGKKQLLRTYRIRSKGLLEYQSSSYAKQLFLCTDELCKNLELTNDDEDIYSADFSTNDEYGYSMIFSKKIIGILKTISQSNVTKERWHEIWHEI